MTCKMPKRNFETNYMSLAHQQDCPFCSNNSTAKPIDHGKSLEFHCDYCSTFQISTDAATRLAQLPLERKSDFSQRAKNHPYGSTLVVSLPVNAIESENIRGMFEAEYVKNSDLAS